MCFSRSMPLPQMQALPLQSSEIGHLAVWLPLPWSSVLAQSSCSKAWLNFPQLCSFPLAHLSPCKWKTPDNLSLKSTDETTAG